MIRVLRVARRGAMKGRIQAGAQIGALILTAPEIDDLDTQLAPLVTAAAPALLALPGVVVETAGQLLVT